MPRYYLTRDIFVEDDISIKRLNCSGADAIAIPFRSQTEISSTAKVAGDVVYDTTNNNLLLFTGSTINKKIGFLGDYELITQASVTTVNNKPIPVTIFSDTTTPNYVFRSNIEILIKQSGGNQFYTLSWIVAGSKQGSALALVGNSANVRSGGGFTPAPGITQSFTGGGILQLLVHSATTRTLHWYFHAKTNIFPSF